MSRWKRLEELEQRIDDFSAQQLEVELSFWRTHTNSLHGPAHKLALKQLRKLESVLARKKSELEADST